MTPRSYAKAAGIRAAVSMYCPASVAPMAGTQKAEISAGTMPRLASAKHRYEPSTMTRTSQQHTMPQPPPNTPPCTRAIVGFEHSLMAVKSAKASAAAVPCARSELSCSWFEILRSMPVQKKRPLAASTTTCTAASLSNAANACTTSRPICG